MHELLVQSNGIQALTLGVFLIGGFWMAMAAEGVCVGVVVSCPMFDCEVVVGEDAEPSVDDGGGAVQVFDVDQRLVIGPPLEMPMLQVIGITLHPIDAGVQLPLRRWPVPLVLAQFLAVILNHHFFPTLLLA